MLGYIVTSYLPYLVNPDYAPDLQRKDDLVSSQCTCFAYAGRTASVYGEASDQVVPRKYYIWLMF